MRIFSAGPSTRSLRTVPPLVATLMVSALVAVSPRVEAAAPAPTGAVARIWNNLALQTVRAKHESDARAARLYALVNVAMYDAVNGLTVPNNRRAPALVEPDESAGGDPEVAAAQAAHDVLAALYDELDTGVYRPTLDDTLRNARAKGEAERGAAWGRSVAAKVLAARANDRSSPSTLAPFAIADPRVYYGGPPPAEDSLDYAAAFNEVRILGDSRKTDQSKTDTFWFWSLGGGSDQPPGAWVQIGQVVSLTRSLSLADTTRLLALETMAMADTVGPTNTTKQTYKRRRPTFAIHDAESDGNPDTADDDNWTARAMTPGGAGEYWSGHSAFSAAGASALAGFFCDDHISFTITTDVQDGAPQANPERTYASFSDAAAEAGLSRVYGGLHFPYSNQAGLRAGHDIAREVLTHSLLLENRVTHQGACPL